MEPFENIENKSILRVINDYKELNESSQSYEDASQITEEELRIYHDETQENIDHKRNKIMREKLIDILMVEADRIPYFHGEANQKLLREARAKKEELRKISKMRGLNKAFHDITGSKKKKYEEIKAKENRFKDAYEEKSIRYVQEGQRQFRSPEFMTRISSVEEAFVKERIAAGANIVRDKLWEQTIYDCYGNDENDGPIEKAMTISRLNVDNLSIRRKELVFGKSNTSYFPEVVMLADRYNYTEKDDERIKAGQALNAVRNVNVDSPEVSRDAFNYLKTMFYSFEDNINQWRQDNPGLFQGNPSPIELFDKAADIDKKFDLINKSRGVIDQINSSDFIMKNYATSEEKKELKEIEKFFNEDYICRLKMLCRAWDRHYAMDTPLEGLEPYY